MEEAGILENFFWSTSHPYDQHFVTIDSVLDTRFPAGDKEVKNTLGLSAAPSPVGQPDVHRQTCEALWDSAFARSGWSGAFTRGLVPT